MGSKMQQRLPPQSKESEIMVLGSMLNSINALNFASDTLDSDDFYYPEHRMIFQAMVELKKEESPADTVLVAERLKAKGLLDAAGGPSYLVTLSNYTTSSAHVEEHAEAVGGKSVLRKIIAVAQRLEAQALKEDAKAGDILEDGSKGLFEIGQKSQKNPYKTSQRFIEGPDGIEEKPFMDWVTERQAYYLEHGDKEDIITGLPMGYKDLDRMLNGMGKGHLLILAARPAMGKTALALNICSNVALQSKKAVGIFSLEMPGEELMLRLLSSAALVDANKIKKGNISGIEYQNLNTASHLIKEGKILYDDQGGIKIGDLKARARRMKENFDIELIMIDYLQLISGSGSRMSQENRQVLVAEISKELKNLAKELNVPVLCLSQLSRATETRDNKMPLLSDLRESGAIEQDADVVMMIHRDDYYDPNSHPGRATVKIAKNRHGETGDVYLTFDKPYFLFKDAAKLENPMRRADEFGDFEST